MPAIVSSGARERQLTHPKGRGSHLSRYSQSKIFPAEKPGNTRKGGFSQPQVKDIKHSFLVYSASLKIVLVAQDRLGYPTGTSMETTKVPLS